MLVYQRVIIHKILLNQNFPMVFLWFSRENSPTSLSFHSFHLLGDIRPHLGIVRIPKPGGDLGVHSRYPQVRSVSMEFWMDLNGMVMENYRKTIGK